MSPIFDPDNALEVESLYTPPMVTAVVLHWKRTENVKGIVAQLLTKPFIDEVIVWNNHPDPLTEFISSSKVRIINSPVNLRDISKYIACAEAKHEVCFYQDDDWDTGHYLDGMYRAYCLQPSRLHTVTGAFTWRQNWVWTYYNEKLDIHAAFSWIGCGAMFPRSMAERYVSIAQKYFSEDEQEIADSGFAVLQNQPIVQMQVSLKKLTQREALSHTEGFDDRLKRLHIKIGRLLPKFSAPEQLAPRCVVRAIHGDKLLFTSFIPFDSPPRLIQFDPNNEADLRYRTRDNISFEKNTKFSRAPFTAAFDVDVRRCWVTKLVAGDTWGVIVNKPSVIQIQLLNIGSDDAEKIWKVATSKYTEAITLGDICNHKFEVESAIFIESYDGYGESLNIKINCSESGS